MSILNHRIEAACVELKLPLVAKLFDQFCDQAARKKQSIRDVLVELLESEVDGRLTRRIQRRLKEAGFPRPKSIESFDFSKSPEISPSMVNELLTGTYIDSAQGIILIGEPGTGKSHLACALGLAACKQGRRVRFATAANLVNDLVEARDTRALSNTVRRYSRYEVLIIDDLGYLPLANHEAELVFQVFAERTEKRSNIITTNLPFSEFTKVFPDKRLCAAVLDRLTHNAHIIDTGTVTKRRPITSPGRKKSVNGPKGGQMKSNKSKAA